MKTLVLEPTATAQWYSLVEEALRASSVYLSEELQSYLIFLLMRFTNRPEMINSVLALDFLQNIKTLTTENQNIIREVGDKCLLYSGFFPGSVKRKHVKISYYVTLGKQSYLTLSSACNQALSNLFANLSDHFVGLMDVLHSMRSLDKNAYLIDLLEAEDLWHTNKSKYALNVIKSATDGFLVPPDPNAVLTKH